MTARTGADLPSALTPRSTLTRTTGPEYRLATPSNPRLWGLGGKYVGPTIPVQAWVAYEKHNDFYGLNVITGTAGDATSTKTTDPGRGVGYTLGDSSFSPTWNS